MVRERAATGYLDIRAVLDKIAESLGGDITIEPDWLSEHVCVLPEDRVRIDPEVWAQLAGCVERRKAIRATYQTFDGRVSEHELHPCHLLAYHGNRYALALNTAKGWVQTFALSRFRRVAATGALIHAAGVVDTLWVGAVRADEYVVKSARKSGYSSKQAVTMPLLESRFDASTFMFSVSLSWYLK